MSKTSCLVNNVIIVVRSMRVLEINKTVREKELEDKKKKKYK